MRDHEQRPGELEYLRLLKLTAELGSSAVGAAVPPWRTESVRQFLCPSLVVTLVEAPVNLAVYDALLGGEVADVA